MMTLGIKFRDDARSCTVSHGCAQTTFRGAPVNFPLKQYRYITQPTIITILYGFICPHVNPRVRNTFISIRDDRHALSRLILSQRCNIGTRVITHLLRPDSVLFARVPLNIPTQYIILFGLFLRENNRLSVIVRNIISFPR